MHRHIGLFSGTFDPIHQGHLAFAAEARRVCGLDEVLFMPERRPRGKHGVTDIAHRIALIERATKTEAAFRVLSLAADQFTVKNTLPELRSLLGKADLTLLIGSDVVRTFSYRWEGLDTLFKEVSFAVGMRADDNPAEITELLAGLEREYGTKIRYTAINTPEAGMASSQIRSNSASAARLHPDTIAYIQEHGLYLNPA
ncbi:MAG TPA: adenylyltransferase/cytidyltransferase family protein [Candidatus Pristimantibacillus sp.]|nr:adenylyltransferase/cytidyltransferase family protein [Candidatus Pristimantibacillus sp.]